MRKKIHQFFVDSWKLYSLYSEMKFLSTGLIKAMIETEETQE